MTGAAIWMFVCDGLFKFDIEWTLYVTVGLTIIAQWHFILFVIHEMTTVLKIRVFHVKDKSE